MKKPVFAVPYLAILFVCTQTMAGTDYNNPVDGRTYNAPDGWKNYYPQNPKPDKQEKVMMVHVVLLTAQEDIAASSSVAE